MAPKARATTMEDKKLLLRMLYKATPKLRRALLADLPTEIVHLLSECALNILKGTVTLKKAHKEKLRKHRDNLHKLAKPKTSLKKKKEIIQTGGFLPGLLAGIVPSLLPIAAPLVGEIVKSIIPPPPRHRY